MLYKRLFSNKKSSLRFAAMGNCQLEFFELDGRPFFTATVFKGRQLQKIELDLAAISVATLGEKGYQLVTRHTTCTFQIVEDKGGVSWGVDAKVHALAALQTLQGAYQSPRFAGDL